MVNWESGIPVIYQQFINNFYGLDSVTQYKYTHLYEYYLFDKLIDIKFEATQTIYPNLNQTGKHCTLLLLTNLEETEWVQIDCHQELLTSVLCVTQKTYHNESQSENEKNKYSCLSRLYCKDWCMLSIPTVQWIRGTLYAKNMFPFSVNISHFK